MTLADTMQERTKDQSNARQRFIDMFTHEGFIQILVISSFAIALIGIFTNADIKNFGGAFHEFYANISSELLSILITVLIIERLNNIRQDKQELTRLKALLASNEAVVTKIAVGELKALGWLEDGSLQRTDLFRANLSGADLVHANLSGAILCEANLSGANLNHANLSGTNLEGANLSGTHLPFANLSGASFGEANLSGAILILADLSGADFTEANLSDMMLPNGKRWTPETDMERFTNLDHPDFWRPEY